MPKESALPGASSGLPVDGKPGSFEWAEEVVEFMNAAWRTREMAEGDFLKAARAAVAHRIWEILSPPFPQEPYTSLEGLIRHTADPGQAENMQIAIRFSGILDEAEAAAKPGPKQPAAVAAAGNAGIQARAAAPGAGDREAGDEGGAPAGRPLSEEEELALGNALLEQYAAQLASRTGADAQAATAADRMVAAGEEVRLPAGPGSPSAGSGTGEGSGSGRPDAAGRSASQRKRDRLERTHPELAEAVDAGEMTLKQAYVQAGIEKEIRTLDKLQKLWRTASEEERDRFLSWLEEQEGAERRREYEEEVYGEDA